MFSLFYSMEAKAGQWTHKQKKEGFRDVYIEKDATNSMEDTKKYPLQHMSKQKELPELQ